MPDFERVCFIRVVKFMDSSRYDGKISSLLFFSNSWRSFEIGGSSPAEITRKASHFL